MRRKLSDNPNNMLALLVIGAFALVIIAAAATRWYRQQDAPRPETPTDPVVVPIPEQTVIEYNTQEEGNEPNLLIEKRKERFGVNQGVDLIVHADESVKIGDTVVPMQEILDRIKLQRGDIVEKSIQGSAADTAGQTPSKPAKAYGIYVVQPGDNTWNIHFQFLKDFFKQRGIMLSPISDEPNRFGASSGVGKLLKFSESMVTVYNIRERRIDLDLNLIQPLSKVVVFDMGQVFSLLDQLDYDRVNHIQFDGETLWVPAKQ